MSDASREIARIKQTQAAFNNALKALTDKHLGLAVHVSVMGWFMDDSKDDQVEVVATVRKKRKNVND